MTLKPLGWGSLWKRPLTKAQVVAAVLAVGPPFFKALDALVRVEGMWSLAERIASVGVLAFLLDWGWAFITPLGFLWLGWSLRTSGRTYRVHELPSELLNETFVDCTFRGPGGLYLKQMDTNLLQSPATRNVSYVAADFGSPDEVRPLPGLVTVHNCQFVRCRFRDLAFVGHEELLSRLLQLAQRIP